MVNFNGKREKEDEDTECSYVSIEFINKLMKIDWKIEVSKGRTILFEDKHNIDRMCQEYASYPEERVELT